MGCFRLAGLLGRRPDELTAGERLMLEDHLGRCQSCRETKRLSAALASLDDASPTPRAAALERVLARALVEPVSVPPRRRWGGPWTPALAGGALAAAIAGGAALRWEDDERLVAVPDSDRLLAGSALVAGAPAEAGRTIASGDTISTDGGAALRLGAAQVDLSAATDVVWMASEATVGLMRGEVHSSVAVTGRTFRVKTPRFTVEVVGTRFIVDLESVRVEEGTVRVLAPGGSVLVAALGSGGRWTMPTESVTHRAAPLAEEPTSASRVATAGHLVRARALLASRDVTAARREIRAALASRPTREEEAEAESLRAEAYLVAGDPREAAARLVRTADRYSDLVAGEAALFAAARLEMQAGRAQVSRRLLERYLARYQRGHLRQEALARLKELPLPTRVEGPEEKRQ